MIIRCTVGGNSKKIRNIVNKILVKQNLDENFEFRETN